MENEIDRLNRSSPSLSIIFISAACGIGAGVIGFYFANILAGLSVEFSAGIATLSLCFGLGFTGALLSFVTGSQAAVSNILFSCGLVGLALLFLAFCTATGALAATLFLAFGR